MKLLVAVPSEKALATVFSRTLRWLPRTGYDWAVFCPSDQRPAFLEKAKDYNYRNYLDMQAKNFVAADGDVLEAVKAYAERHGYGIVLMLEDDVLRFNDAGKTIRDDEMVLHFHKAIMRCRIALENYKDLGAISFEWRQNVQDKEFPYLNAPLLPNYLIRTELLTTDLPKPEWKTLRYARMGADIGKVEIEAEVFGEEVVKL